MVILLYICCFLIDIVALEFLMITRKRIVLVRRLKKVCKQEGHKIRFARNRFKSVFFDKGKLDLVIEGEKGKYAVIILTSRPRRARWQFSDETMEIYKKVSLRLGGGARTTRSGASFYRSSREVASFTTRKESFCLAKDGTFTAVPSLDLPKGYIKGTVGAGDAFCAGCLYGIYNGWSDKAILEFAAGAAACNLSAEDSVSGMKDKNAIFELIGSMKK